MFKYVRIRGDFRYAAFCKSNSEIWPISEITVTIYMLRFSCAHTHTSKHTHICPHTQGAT